MQEDNLIDNIIAKLVTGNISEVTDKEIQIAQLFELKSVKKELVSLNDKIDILEIKIDETASNSISSTKALEAKYDLKFQDIENRMREGENSHLENTFIKKLVDKIPIILSAIVSIAIIFGYLARHK